MVQITEQEYMLMKVVLYICEEINPLINNIQRINCYEQQNNDTYVDDV